MSSLYAGPGRHHCPRRGCDRTVADVLFCCPDDWAVLPAEVRNLIVETRTASLLAPTRRYAVGWAAKAWAEL